MGWTHIPDLEYSPADNPWVGHRAQPVGKVSVVLPPEDWLCRKLENLNLVLIEGYPSKSSEPGGLHVDQFLRPPKSQNRWYGIHPAEPKDPSRPGKSVNTWPNDVAKLNSAFPRNCKPAVGNSHPPGRPIAQDTLRKWEKAAKETSYVCNQSAVFNRCITKIQDSVQKNLKSLQTELSKGKSFVKAQAALDELHYLASFNQNVSFAMGKSLQHLSDFIFVQMANLTLARRDVYLDNLKPGVKPDTFSALLNCPLNGYALFPDAILRKAEDEITQYENTKRTSQPGSGRGGFAGGFKKQQNRFQPYPASWKQSQDSSRPRGKLTRICLPGNHLATGVDLGVEAGVVNQDAAPALPRTKLNINDNYCFKSPVHMDRPVDGVLSVQRQNFHVAVQQPVLCPVVSLVPFVLNVRGRSQKKDGSPSSSIKTEINFVKSAFSVDHCVLAPNVPNVHNAANARLVGGRLQNFWKIWSLLCANPRVVSILKDGYILPFKTRPPLVRDPLIISGYANPPRNLYLQRLCIH